MTPIKGLTDTVRPAFPSIGKLRKGGPRPQDGRRPGEELDYWRFTSKTPEVVEAFVVAYTDKPQALDVYLPYARIEDNFSAWKETWLAGGLQHRCDGETCTVWLKEDGTYSREPKPCPGGCKEVGRLSVVLPALIRAGHVGYVTMETHSLHDIMSIQAALMATVEHMGHEDLRGIFFCLRRVEQEIPTPGKAGKRVRRKRWLVKLQPAAVWVTAQLEASRVRAMLPALRVRAMLPADDVPSGGVVIDGETGEVIDGLPPDEMSASEAATRAWWRGEEPEADPGQPSETSPSQTSGEVSDDVCEEAEPEQEESPKAEPHWIYDSAKRNRFWANANDAGLDHDAVHHEWNVESMKDTTLSFEQSLALLKVAHIGLQELGVGLMGVYQALDIHKLADLIGCGKKPLQIEAELRAWVTSESSPSETSAEVPDDVCEKQAEAAPPTGEQPRLDEYEEIAY